MYVTGFTKPVLDDRPGHWKLLDAGESGGLTSLKFSRKINTCDSQDYPIGVRARISIYLHNFVPWSGR